MKMIDWAKPVMLRDGTPCKVILPMGGYMLIAYRDAQGLECRKRVHTRTGWVWNIMPGEKDCVNVPEN